MPKITVHGGPTNAGEEGYFEAIEAARVVDGVPAADKVKASGVDMVVGVSYQVHPSALDAYRAKMAELGQTPAEALASLGEPPAWTE